MSGKEKAWSFGFNVRQQLPETAVAEIVLRDGSRVINAVLKSGPAFQPKNNLQVFARDIKELLRRKSRQVGVPFTANIAGERHVSGWRSVRKQRRREYCAEDSESLDLRDQHAKA